MAISLECDCGKQLRVGDEYAGRRIKCPACAEILSVPTAASGLTASKPKAKVAAPAKAAAAPAMLRFACDECGERLSAKPEAAGKTIKCTECGERVTVPDPDDRSEDDEDEERPARKPKKKAASGGLPIWAFVVAGVLLLLVVGGGIGGCIWYFASGSKGDSKSAESKGADSKSGDGKSGDGAVDLSKQADLAFVPDGAALVISARAADIWKNSKVQALVAQQGGGNFASEMEKETGLKLADVERVTFVVLNPESQGQDGVAIFLTAVPYDQAMLKKAFGGDKLTEIKHKDKVLYQQLDKTGKPGEVIHFASERVLLLGQIATTKKILDAPARTKTTGPVAEGLRLAARGNHQVAGGMIVPPSFKNQLNNFGGPPPRGGPAGQPNTSPFAPLGEMDGALLTMNLRDKLETEVTLTFPSEDKATKGKEACDALKSLMQLGLGNNPNSKVMLDALASLQISAKGQNVVLAMQNDFDPKQIGLLAQMGAAPPNPMPNPNPNPMPNPNPNPMPMPMPNPNPNPNPMPTAPLTPNEQQSQENLKKIAQAMQQYHAKYGNYPPAIVYGPTGLPLYSWRVLLLPFLGEQQLYNEWKKDEPWNSSYNARFQNRMPLVYAPPGSPKGVMVSIYKVFVGPDLPFQAYFQNQPVRLGPRMQDITDGPGNTVLLVEDGLNPVSWAAPNDILQTGPNQPVPATLGLSNSQTINVAMFDGSVKRVPKNLPATTWKAVLTPRGGEQVPADWPR